MEDSALFGFVAGKELFKRFHFYLVNGLVRFAFARRNMHYHKLRTFFHNNPYMTVFPFFIGIEDSLRFDAAPSPKNNIALRQLFVRNKNLFRTITSPLDEGKQSKK